jgi:hypothetical protein
MKTVLTIAVLSLFLAGACVLAYWGWNSVDVEMPVSGYIAMGLGIFFSLVVGIVLMGLIFYSDRAGYDEPTHFDLT